MAHVQLLVAHVEEDLSSDAPLLVLAYLPTDLVDIRGLVTVPWKLGKVKTYTVNGGRYLISACLIYRLSRSPAFAPCCRRTSHSLARWQSLQRQLLK